MEWSLHRLPPSLNKAFLFSVSFFNVFVCVCVVTMAWLRRSEDSYGSKFSPPTM